MQRLAPRRIPAPGAALVLFLALSVLLCLPAWLNPTTRWIGAPGDANTLMWMLRWTPWAIQHGTNPFFTDRIIYPHGVNLMWNTSVFLPALVAWPITLTLGVVAAYNVVMTVGIAGSGWCAYLAARRWLGSEPAAIAAGLVYGFSPFLITQLTFHLSMVIAWEPPLLLLLLDDILVRQRRGPVKLGILLGLLSAAQFFVMEDVVLSSALVVGVLCAVLLVRQRQLVRAKWRRAAIALGTALAVMIGVVGYALAFQLFGPNPIHAQFHPPGTFVADPINLVIPTSLQWLSSSLLDPVTSLFPGRGGDETTLYLGLPLVALASIHAWRQRHEPFIQICSLGLLTALVLSFGGYLHLFGRVSPVPLPGIILESLPFLNDMILSRFALYVDLFAALLFGHAVATMFAKPRTRRSVTTTAVALALVAITLLPRLPVRTTADETPAFFTSTVSHTIPDNAVVLVAPMAFDPHHTIAMQWHAEANLGYVMPEGYLITGEPSPAFPYGPPASATFWALVGIQLGWQTPESEETPQVRQAILGDLQEWNVQYVVVGPMERRAETVGFIEWMLGRHGEARDGVDIWKVP